MSKYVRSYAHAYSHCALVVDEVQVLQVLQCRPFYRLVPTDFRKISVITITNIAGERSFFLYYCATLLQCE